MAARFFGTFCVERGSVSSGDLARAVEYQQQRSRGWDEVALREGLLTREAVGRVHAAIRTSGRPFREVALSLGVLDEGTLNRILEAQRAEYLPIGEALVSVGALTPEQLSVALDEFTRTQEGERARIDQEKRTLEAERHPLHEECLNETANFLIQVASIITKLGPTRVVAGPLPAFDVQVVVGIEGPWSGDYVLRLDERMAQRLGTRMLDEPSEEEGAHRAGLVAFAENVCRQAVTSVPHSGGRFSVHPAKVLEQRASPLEARRGGVVFSLESVDGPIEVALLPS